MKDEKTIEYFNDLLNRLEEIFYHELSGCARPKSELVGIDFLSSKKIKGNSVEELVDNCIREIKAGKLVKDISYSIHGSGILIKLQVKNCIHLPKEIKIKREGIEPYCCPIANMILDRILEKLNYLTTYTAGIEVHEDENECTLKCAIYESMDKIGQVSDWTKC
ncbi:hypothetical protein [[Eubacterium] cellulosolvens]